MKNQSKPFGIVAMVAATIFFMGSLTSCDDRQEDAIISVKNTQDEEITVSIEQMNSVYQNNVIDRPYTDVPIPANSTKDFTFPYELNQIYYYRVRYVTSDPAKNGRKSVIVGIITGYNIAKYIVEF